MPTVYDVPANRIIDRLAIELEKVPELTPPEWHIYVKTGVNREYAPTQKNWWFIRAASILRKLYLNGPMGVSRLRLVYGGVQGRGSKPEKFKRGSGAIIRTLIQQLEQSALIAPVKGKGRRISSSGISLIDKLATEIAREKPELSKYT